MDTLFDGEIEPPRPFDVMAFITARMAEDRQYAEGLKSACCIPDEIPDFTGCGGPAAVEYWRHFGPGRVLAEIDATERLIAEIVTTAHAYEPGTGCASAQPLAGPCTCGRDARVARILGTVARKWNTHPDYRAG